MKKFAAHYTRISTIFERSEYCLVSIFAAVSAIPCNVCITHEGAGARRLLQYLHMYGSHMVQGASQGLIKHEFDRPLWNDSPGEDCRLTKEFAEPSVSGGSSAAVGRKPQVWLEGENEYPTINILGVRRSHFYLPYSARNCG